MNRSEAGKIGGRASFDSGRGHRYTSENASAAAKARWDKPRPPKAFVAKVRTYFGDGLSDAPAPAPQGPPMAELIADAKRRRREMP